MMRYDSPTPPVMNSSRRLPIVFCLDVSPSMNWEVFGSDTAMELMNEAVKRFISDLNEDAKIRTCAEIAFVTYSSGIELDTEFYPVKNLEVPRFKAVKEGGTQTSMAVLRSIEKIEEHRRDLENMDIAYYAPFLVLITDGNPDENDDPTLEQRALKLVKSHCSSSVGASEIIIPFVIGVGDFINPETLKKYSAGFVDGYFPIKGSSGTIARIKFNKVFQMIGNSTKKTVNLNKSIKAQQQVIDIIGADMGDLIGELREIDRPNSGA